LALVDPDLGAPVPCNGERLIVAHALILVVLDHGVPVALPVEEHLLCTLLVLEAQLVEAPTPRRALCAPAGPRLFGGQRERHRMRPVVERSKHHRLVRVAAFKDDYDLHANARNELNAPASASPRLHRADPARALVVVFSLAIPMELNLDPTGFVDV